MKIKYCCNFCDDYFYTEEECRRHELECWDNKTIKACPTCKHQTEDVGGTNKVYWGCKKNVFKPSPIDGKKNCESWEWDEGYAH